MPPWSGPAHGRPERVERGLGAEVAPDQAEALLDVAHVGALVAQVVDEQRPQPGHVAGQLDVLAEPARLGLLVDTALVDALGAGRRARLGGPQLGLRVP